MVHESPERVRNHWYWRPGWQVGRRFYTWHLTFADQPDVVTFADSYRNLLEAMSETDAIPARWLHLTMQGVGFIDDVEPHDIDAILDAARKRCAALRPFALTVGAPYVDVEAIQIDVQPPEPVAELRRTLRAAIADVWGTDRVPEVEEPFLPHMSLAYINRDGPAAPLAATVARNTPPAAHADITHCQLIVINRDSQMYTWETRASVRLGDGLTKPHGLSGRGKESEWMARHDSPPAVRGMRARDLPPGRIVWKAAASLDSRSLRRVLPVPATTREPAFSSFR